MQKSKSLNSGSMFTKDDPLSNFILATQQGLDSIYDNYDIREVVYQQQSDLLAEGQHREQQRSFVSRMPQKSQDKDQCSSLSQELVNWTYHDRQMNQSTISTNNQQIRGDLVTNWICDENVAASRSNMQQHTCARQATFQLWKGIEGQEISINAADVILCAKVRKVRFKDGYLSVRLEDFDRGQENEQTPNSLDKDTGQDKRSTNKPNVAAEHSVSQQSNRGHPKKQIPKFNPFEGDDSLKANEEGDTAEKAQMGSQHVKVKKESFEQMLDALLGPVLSPQVNKGMNQTQSDNISYKVSSKQLHGSQQGVQQQQVQNRCKQQEQQQQQLQPVCEEADRKLIKQKTMLSFETEQWFGEEQQPISLNQGQNYPQLNSDRNLYNRTGQQYFSESDGFLQTGPKAEQDVIGATNHSQKFQQTQLSSSQLGNSADQRTYNNESRQNVAQSRNNQENRQGRQKFDRYGNNLNSCQYSHKFSRQFEESGNENYKSDKQYRGQYSQQQQQQQFQTRPQQHQQQYFKLERRDFKRGSQQQKDGQNRNRRMSTGNTNQYGRQEQHQDQYKSLQQNSWQQSVRTEDKNIFSQDHW